MPSGGYRPGAGRPRKNPADKVVAGNPGHREITIAKFDTNQNIKISKEPPKFLSTPNCESSEDVPSAVELFKMTWDFIKLSKCENLISPHLVEDFANIRQSYLECENTNRRLGRILNGKRSPYVSMALEYLSKSQSLFNQIWQIINANTQESIGDKNEFLELLNSRGF